MNREESAVGRILFVYGENADDDEGDGVLRNHTLFRGVPLHELEGAVQSMHEELFHDGDPLIVEGSYGNSCYFIMSGQVQIVSRNLIGHTVTLDVLGEGALIGEVSLFLEEKGLRVRRRSAK